MTSGKDSPELPAEQAHTAQEHTQHAATACLDEPDQSGDGDGDQAPELSGGEQPWIDVDSTEGAAIVSLFRRLKDLETPDGSWPGGDVVDAITAWLPTVGLHPDDDPDTAARRLRTQTHPWTVFALRDNDCEGEILIAGVVAGSISCRDTDAGEEDGYQRVAESVLAVDADEAEGAAYELFEAARQDD